jgi:lipopolysaccharide transport system permease protein
MSGGIKTAEECAMTASSTVALPVARTIIEPRARSVLDLRELWDYRELLSFLIWRDVKTRYSQSVLGLGWAIVQPVSTMVVFTVVFGRLAGISSDGVPYAIFSYTALVPWAYFAGALSGATGSVNAAGGMISKVYFPRLIIPIVPVVGKLVDFCVALMLLVALMVWFRIVPSRGLLVIPVLVVLMMTTAAGAGMWLTALAAQYRDVNHGLAFAVQLLMYLSPVVYPASTVPPWARPLYGVNPMAGVIEGFRSAFLGTQPMPWGMIGTGSVVSLVLLWYGSRYFQSKERLFADIL